MSVSRKTRLADQSPLFSLQALLYARNLDGLVREGKVLLPTAVSVCQGAAYLEYELNEHLKFAFSKHLQSGEAFAEAVLNLFSASSDRQGHIQEAVIREEYGPAWGALVGHIRALPELPSPHSHAAFPSQLHRSAWSATRLKSTLTQLREARPQQTLVTQVLRRFAVPDQLKGTGLIASQHLYESEAQMLEGLESVGLLPAHTTVLGKRYSGTPQARAELLDRGFDVDNLDFFEGESGDRYRSIPNPTNSRQFALRAMHGRLARKEMERLAIVDDGADMVLELHRTLPEVAPLTAAVEQTRLGIRRLREVESQLRLPVVNVAECPTKLNVESVLIGWSVAAEIQRTAEKLASLGIPRGKRVTLFGYGAVGRHTAILLQEMGFKVDVVDPAPTARQRAIQDNIHVEKHTRRALGSADYVVGATGTEVFDSSAWKHLKDGAVLFSASSSNLEFLTPDARALLSQPDEKGPVSFRGKTLPRLNWEESNGPDRVLRFGKKEFLLAKSGTPINLTADPDPIAADLIDLTRSLIELGILQASRLSGFARGICPLDSEGQRFILESWMPRVRRRQPPVPAPVLRLLEEGYAETVRALSSPDALDVDWSTPLLPVPALNITLNPDDPSEKLIDFRKKRLAQLETRFNLGDIPFDSLFLQPGEESSAQEVVRELAPNWEPLRKDNQAPGKPFREALGKPSITSSADSPIGPDAYKENRTMGISIDALRNRLSGWTIEDSGDKPNVFDSKDVVRKPDGTSAYYEDVVEAFYQKPAVAAVAAPTGANTPSSLDEAIKPLSNWVKSLSKEQIQDLVSIGLDHVSVPLPQGTRPDLAGMGWPVSGRNVQSTITHLGLKIWKNHPAATVVFFAQSNVGGGFITLAENGLNSPAEPYRGTVDLAAVSQAATEVLAKVQETIRAHVEAANRIRTLTGSK